MIPLLIVCLISFVSNTCEKPSPLDAVARLLSRANHEQQSLNIQQSLNDETNAQTRTNKTNWEDFKKKLKKTHRRSNTIVDSGVMYGSRWDQNEIVKDTKEQQ
jgi:hypothetical protein